MRRIRRLAIVLVAVGLVTSAVYATGAFSSLGTSRDANVNVAGDKAGYLGLAPGENGQYTTYQNGKLQLQLNGALGGEDAPSGGGVNHGAETAIDSVFTITNQGAQSVGVWLADTDDHIEFERADGGSLEEKGNAVRLAPGDTVHVGLTIDTTDTDADQLDTQLIINADSDVEGTNAGTGSENSEGTQLPASSSTPEEDELSNGNDDSDDSSDEDKYENCDGWLDGDCHVGNTLTWGGETKSEIEDSADEEADKFTDDPGEYIKEKNPLRDDYKSTREQREKLIQKLRDNIEFVFDFLDSHPGIERMLVATNPGAATLAGWVDLNPEKATSLALGLLLGEGGLPDGMHEVPEADSAFYVVGWLGPGLIPWINVAPDARDWFNSTLTLNGTGFVLNSLALGSNFAGLKGFGYGDVLKVGGFLGKWTANVASTGTKSAALKSTSKYVLPYLSSSAKAAGTNSRGARMSVVVMDALSDGAASTLVKNDVPMDTIVEYAQQGKLTQRAETVEEAGWPAIQTLEKNGLNDPQMEKLAGQGYDTDAITTLLEEGLQGDEVWRYAQKDKIDFTKAKDFLDTDGVTIYNVRRIADEGGNFKKAETAYKKDVPVEHIEYYTKNDNDLDVVIKAKEVGVPVKFIKGVHQAVNKGKVVTEISPERRKEIIEKSGMTLGEFYIMANNYCDWQGKQQVDEDWEYKDTCETLPTQSSNATDTTG